MARGERCSKQRGDEQGGKEGGKNRVFEEKKVFSVVGSFSFFLSWRSCKKTQGGVGLHQDIHPRLF